MTPKIIVNSISMRNLIHLLNVEKYEEHEDIVLCVDSCQLFFLDDDANCIACEPHGQAFRAKVSPKQLRKFCRVLSLLEEQPITISIGDTPNWINFSAVI